MGVSTLNRRYFLRGSLAVAGASLLSGCGIVGRQTQPTKLPRIGWLAFGAPAGMMPLLDSLRLGLKELGWIEGQNLMIEARWAEGQQKRLAELAAELVGLDLDLIVTQATPASLAVKAATSRIPIVAVSISDPVGSGLVQSVARPNTNVTGLGLNPPELGAKRLQLLKETAPAVSRVAMLWNPDNPVDVADLAVVQGAAPSLGVELQSLPVRVAADIDGALQRATEWRADGLMFMASAVITCCVAQLVSFAAYTRLPAIYDGRSSVIAGGLMAYSGDIYGNYHHAAILVDKVLKGAKPADLPIEQPTTFNLVINLKTAQELGLTIPQSALQQATEVIQ